MTPFYKINVSVYTKPIRKRPRINLTCYTKKKTTPTNKEEEIEKKDFSKQKPRKKKLTYSSYMYRTIITHKKVLRNNTIIKNTVIYDLFLIH